MKKYRFIIVLFAICSVTCVSDAKAQSVYSYSDITYFPQNNQLYAVSEAISDYPAELYYCLLVAGPVSKDGVEQAYITGNNYENGTAQCGGWATAWTWLPYDANAEYKVEASHEVETLYRMGNESASYEDYFNFSIYEAQYPSVYDPGWFNFSGPGPSIPGFRHILLGIVYTVFTQGAASGNPHHLEVVSDLILEGGCGQYVRKMKYRIVDANHHAAGGPAMMEKFLPYSGPQSRVDSCSNNTVRPSACSGSYPGQPNGTFVDQHNTGCPWNWVDECGFQVMPLEWSRCYPGGFEPLARVYVNVKRNYISVNGRTTGWPDGPYPNGTCFYNQ